MLEKKVYTCWAFDEDAAKKRRINEDIYDELQDKVRYIYKGDKCTTDDLLNFCCLECIGSGYANMKYRVLSNPYNFSNDELALLADRGNLCFGYRMQDSNVVVVYID